MDARPFPSLTCAVLLIVAFAHTECARSPRRAALASPAAEATKSKTYRLLHNRGWPLPDGRTAWISDGGRVALARDGAIEFAWTKIRYQGTPGGAPMTELLGGVPVPARFGGGFLFWDTEVYRARSFLGRFEPVAALFQTNNITVRFGHDSLLIIGPENGERHLYDMERGVRVPLWPHGVTEIEGAEGDRVIATNAAGRALASMDGGKQWSDVTAKLGAPVVGLHGAADEVWFELCDREHENAEGAWLQPNGQLTRRAVHAACGSESTAEPSPEESAQAEANRAIELAVSSGIPLSGNQGNRALVAAGTQVRVVDLEMGRALGPAREVGPEGSSCEALSSDEEGLVACYGPSYRQGYGPDFVAVVSHVLGAHPRIERQFEGQPAVSYGVGSLLVEGRCSGTQEAGFMCERRAGVWIEHDARKTLRGKEVAFWVPKEDGGAAAILGQLDVSGFLRDPVWLNGDSGAAIPLRHAAEQVGDHWILKVVNAYRLAAKRTVTEWVIKRDGTLRGFTATGSVAVDAQGRAGVGPRAMQYVSAFTDRALARDGEYSLWQSTDYGATWKQVERPPYDPARALRPHDNSFPVCCSLLGCVVSKLDFGTWLRIGWPEEPPQVSKSASANDGAAADLVVLPQLPPPPPLPIIECTGRGGHAPQGPHWPSDWPPSESTNRSAQPRPHPTPAPEGDFFMVVFGGRRLPVRQAGRTFANVDYRDRYENAMYWPSYALRAVAHYEAPAIVDGANLDESQERAGRSESNLIESRKPLEVLFTEDFDFSGRIFEAKGSFSQWPAVAQDLSTEGIDGSARPVLSADAGHANGVLLIDGSLTLWADDRGGVHPVIGRNRCRPFGGYVDRQGQLFVICNSVVEAADGSKAVLQAPDFFPSFPEELPHYKSVGAIPPIEGQFLLNPDAVAVDKEGRVGVLRLPSGAEPSTVDDPAWWFTKDAPPAELAPWSALQLATSAACTHSDDGVRAILQTPFPWVTVAGSAGFDGPPRFPEQPGMKALVRWSRERVCLEAIELGYLGIRGNKNWRHPLTPVMLVARFVGRDPGAALVAFNASAAYREPVSCVLRGADMPSVVPPR